MNESVVFKKDYKKVLKLLSSFTAAIVLSHFVYEVFVLKSDINAVFNIRILSVFLVPPITLAVMLSVFPRITRLKISNDSIVVSSRLKHFESRWSDISTISLRPHKGRLFSFISQEGMEIYIPEKEFSNEDEKLIETKIIAIAKKNGICVNT